MSDIRFDGRVAVITGAGGGLGKTYALELARRGASVVVNDLGGSSDGRGGSSSMADATVKEIIEAGGKAAANYDSVATPEGGKAIIQTALDNFGKVDIVVNNAGFLRDKSFLKLEPQDLQAIIDVHLKGAFFVTQPAFASMMAPPPSGVATESVLARASPPRAAISATVASAALVVPPVPSGFEPTSFTTTRAPRRASSRA